MDYEEGELPETEPYGPTSVGSFSSEVGYQPRYQTPITRAGDTIHTDYSYERPYDSQRPYSTDYTYERPQETPYNADHRHLPETGSQNNTGTELGRILEHLVRNLPGNQSRQISVPIFHPEGDGANPKSWLRTVDLCFFKNPCAGSDLILTLSNALKGRAAEWFSRISHENLTWREFKTLFHTEYIHLETAASTFLTQMNSRPRDDYVTYISQMLGDLDACFRDLTKEEIAISFALAHLGRLDRRVEHLSSTRDIRSREVLLRELRFFSTGKRRALTLDSTSPQPESKRPRFSRPYCQNCRAPGHWTSDCRGRRAPVPVRERAAAAPVYKPNHQPANRPQERKKTIVCYRCHEPGHYSTKCPKKTADGRPTESRVGLCSINPVGQLVHKGELHNFLFDSGSECSLMTIGIASKFEGNQISKTVNLFGLGQSTVTSTSQVLSSVTIDGHQLEILFHIVPDKILNEPIVIGREIMKDNFSVVMDKNRYYLKKGVSIEANNSARFEPKTSTCHEESTLESLHPTELEQLLTQLCNDDNKGYQSGIQNPNSDGIQVRLMNSDNVYESILTTKLPRLVERFGP
uniref:CCHC-type domain-containing protein n=1 Tax=Cacopsylla melanoneura TaxID=428564 RepID=A0A8D8VGV3_9HEMI